MSFLFNMVGDVSVLICCGGIGNCERRRLLCITSDHGIPNESWLVRLGSRNGEIGEGFGKPMDVAECDRLTLRFRSPDVLDRRSGVLNT
jgi:hypothetical protein